MKKIHLLITTLLSTYCVTTTPVLADKIDFNNITLNGKIYTKIKLASYDKTTGVGQIEHEWGSKGFKIEDLTENDRKKLGILFFHSELPNMRLARTTANKKHDRWVHKENQLAQQAKKRKKHERKLQLDKEKRHKDRVGKLAKPTKPTDRKQPKSASKRGSLFDPKPNSRSMFDNKRKVVAVVNAGRNKENRCHNGDERIVGQRSRIIQKDINGKIRPRDKAVVTGKGDILPNKLNLAGNLVYICKVSSIKDGAILLEGGGILKLPPLWSYSTLDGEEIILYKKANQWHALCDNETSSITMVKPPRKAAAQAELTHFQGSTHHGEKFKTQLGTNYTITDSNNLLGYGSALTDILIINDNLMIILESGKKIAISRE